MKSPQVQPLDLGERQPNVAKAAGLRLIAKHFLVHGPVLRATIWNCETHDVGTHDHPLGKPTAQHDDIDAMLMLFVAGKRIFQTFCEKKSNRKLIGIGYLFGVTHHNIFGLSNGQRQLLGQAEKGLLSVH
jgi:hypothetical protein